MYKQTTTTTNICISYKLAIILNACGEDGYVEMLKIMHLYLFNQYKHLFYFLLGGWIRCVTTVWLQHTEQVTAAHNAAPVIINNTTGKGNDCCP